MNWRWTVDWHADQLANLLFLLVIKWDLLLFCDLRFLVHKRSDLASPRLHQQNFDIAWTYWWVTLMRVILRHVTIHGERVWFYSSLSWKASSTIWTLLTSTRNCAVRDDFTQHNSWNFHGVQLKGHFGKKAWFWLYIWDGIVKQIFSRGSNLKFTNTYQMTL